MTGKRRLNVDMDPDQHRRVKAALVRMDLTLSNTTRALWSLWEEDPHLQARACVRARQLETDGRGRATA